MNKSTNKEPIIVYWGFMTSEVRQTQVSLMWGAPVPLIQDIEAPEHTDIGESYRACRGVNPFLKRTFMFLHPKSASVEIPGGLNEPVVWVSDFNAWRGRPSSIKDRLTIDYDYMFLFFCDEPLVAQQFPPFLHDTTADKTASLATGEHDIHRWFRSLTPTYILHKGKNTVNITEGEPVFYIEFKTDRKIILKQFEATPEITQIAKEVALHKQWFRFENLEKLYERFTGSNRHKRVSKLIHENLLE